MDKRRFKSFIGFVKCPICNDNILRGYEELRNHMASFHLLNQYSCIWCRQPSQYPRKVDYQHMHECFIGSQLAICPTTVMDEDTTQQQIVSRQDLNLEKSLVDLQQYVIMKDSQNSELIRTNGELVHRITVLEQMIKSADVLLQEREHHLRTQSDLLNQLINK